jgi:membrane-bound lytic murein transglycosylase B
MVLRLGPLLFLSTAFSLPLLIGRSASSTPDPSSYRSRADLAPTANVRGWDYVAEKLRADAITERELAAVYENPRIPPFEFVPFGVHPREPADIYAGFAVPSNIELARSFLSRYRDAFDRAEATYHVRREAVAAILLVETQFGANVGKSLVVERLSRVASVGSPENVRWNYARLRRDDPLVTFEEVEARSRYLERTFYPELLAMFKMAREFKIHPLTVYGSSAGAFGLPQFLPTSFLRYGTDGNGDQRISLFDREDAILSIARYLSAKGWVDDGPEDARREAIWRYNKSKPYIDTILTIVHRIADRPHRVSRPPSKSGEQERVYRIGPESAAGRPRAPKTIPRAPTQQRRYGVKKGLYGVKKGSGGSGQSPGTTAPMKAPPRYR